MNNTDRKVDIYERLAKHWRRFPAVFPERRPAWRWS